MEIVQVGVSSIAVPLCKPYTVSYGTIYDSEAVVVTIRTNNGIMGYGEANPLLGFTYETPASVVGVLKAVTPKLIGKDPCNPNEIRAFLDSMVAGNYSAKGAIDMACYDILGKALHVPVSTLLGGALRKELPLLWPLGSGTAEQDRVILDQKIEEGYSTFMLKMGVQSIPKEIERVQQLVEHYGDSIHLTVDPNTGWTVPDAVQFVNGIHHLHIDMIEQPIAAHDIAGMAYLRDKASSPLSADEALVTPQDAMKLARGHPQGPAVDIFSVKIAKHGGFTPSKKIASIAEGAGIKCLVNSMLENGVTQAAALQLAVSLPNLLDMGHCFMSTLRLKDDFTDFSSHIKRGVVTLPDKPGLGITILEDKLKQYTVDEFQVNAPEK